MGIYFRYILIIRISRGSNNCGHCVLEKKYLLPNVIPPPPHTHTFLIIFVLIKDQMYKQCRLISTAFFDHIYQGYE